MRQEDRRNLHEIRLGFALSGGGARGAYTAGVMCGLRDAGIVREDLGNVKVLVGVSTGALVAAGVANGDFAALKRLYTEIRTEEVIRPTHPLAGSLLGLRGQLVMSAAFGPPYLYDTAPLRKLVRTHVGPDGFRRMIERKGSFEVSFVSVDLVTGEVRTLGNQTPDVKAEALEDAVMASTNQPVLMDPVPIETHLHCDGGLRDFLPGKQLMQSAFAKDLDVFVTVPLEVAGGPPERPNPEKIFDVLLRTIELLSYDVGDSDQLATELVDAIIHLRREVGPAKWDLLTKKFSPRVQKLLRNLYAPSTTLQFLTIRPQEIPIADSLAFRPEELQKAFALGYADGPAEVETWLDGIGRQYVAERLAERGGTPLRPADTEPGERPRTDGEGPDA